MPSVHCVEAFNDNYLWVICEGEHAAVVDPGDAAPIKAFLAENHLHLDAILLTHHHNDHVGGVSQLVDDYGAMVYGKPNEKMPHCDVELVGNEIIELSSLNLPFKVITTPGHTMDHLCYFNDEWLFCGDTLFAGGCGRLFEGTPANMHASLSQLRTHCKNHLLFCAHEYTEANLRFAAHIEPHNETVHQRLEAVIKQRINGERTVPSNMEIELKTNPFLRFDDPVFIDALNAKTGHHLTEPVEVFALTRKLKDHY